MRLEEKLAADMAKQIADDIDWQILSDIYVQMGYTKVIVDADFEKEWELKIWALGNCKGNYQHRGSTFIFEDVKDANWFKLRWLS